MQCSQRCKNVTCKLINCCRVIEVYWFISIVEAVSWYTFESHSVLNLFDIRPATVWLTFSSLALAATSSLALACWLLAAGPRENAEEGNVSQEWSGLVPFMKSEVSEFTHI